MARKLCEVCSDEDDPETFDLDDNEQVRKELTDTVTAQPGKLTGLHAEYAAERILAASRVAFLASARATRTILEVGAVPTATTPFLKATATCTRRTGGAGRSSPPWRRRNAAWCATRRLPPRPPRASPRRSGSVTGRRQYASCHSARSAAHRRRSARLPRRAARVSPAWVICSSSGIPSPGRRDASPMRASSRSGPLGLCPSSATSSLAWRCALAHAATIPGTNKVRRPKMSRC